jgi:hypothetical protein
MFPSSHTRREIWCMYVSYACCQPRMQQFTIHPSSSWDAPPCARVMLQATAEGCTLPRVVRQSNVSPAVQPPLSPHLALPRPRCCNAPVPLPRRQLLPQVPHTLHLPIAEAAVAAAPLLANVSAGPSCALPDTAAHAGLRPPPAAQHVSASFHHCCNPGTCCSQHMTAEQRLRIAQGH